MKLSIPHALVASLLAAGTTLGAGCGTSQRCDIEKNALAELPVCLTPVAPGGRVEMKVRVVEKCWQSYPTCTVGMKGDQVVLDVTTEACLDASSCTGPAREVESESCWFYAPTTEGTYHVQVTDPEHPDSPQSYDFIVSNGGALDVSCYALTQVSAP